MSDGMMRSRGTSDDARASANAQAPLIIHVVNIAALAIGGCILLLAAATSREQLMVLLPVLALGLVYWRLRRDARIAAAFFGLSLALFGWILLCENIVRLDRLLGTQISQQLPVGLRLQRYIIASRERRDGMAFEPCCDDPLSWRYRPGSRYRATFDCPTCNAPYEVVVDETGFLNRPPARLDSHVDLFVAGDSVLQGIGMPSVVERLRDLLPLRLWNLSIQAYGARQKVNALLSYALPRRPKWLIVEFYASNDLSEAIRDDLCDDGGDFHCRYNDAEVLRRLRQHPVYPAIFAIPTDIVARFTDLAAENLTLATTRYLVDALKGALRELLEAHQPPAAAPHEAVREFFQTGISTPAWSPWPVRDGQQPTYLSVGMALIQRQYDRLAARLQTDELRPTVILLYNPTPYELYRGMWVAANPAADYASTFQRQALQAFAQRHGWRYLDLTEPLRQEVQRRRVWIYGRYDKSHWSPQGTELVAGVLAAELRKLL
jgi:hypothetical protein